MENSKHCPHFDTCSQGRCPLDINLALQPRREQDKCRWMREAKTTKIKSRVFVTGGAAMPNAILCRVPQCNVKWLNAASRRLWSELSRKINQTMNLSGWNKQPDEQNLISPEAVSMISK